MDTADGRFLRVWAAWAALAVALAMTACSGDRAQRPTPSASVAPPTDSATVRPSATATVAATATPVPAPPALPTVRRYARGETVEETSGLLLLDPVTGGAEAWQGAYIVSPSGRYLAGEASLVDRSTGEIRALVYEGAPLRIASFSPDETRYAAATDRHGGVFALASGDPVYPPIVREPPRTRAGAVPFQAAWSLDGTRVGLGGISLSGWVLVIDGQVRRLDDRPGHQARWSRDGARFAVANAEGPSAIYDAASATLTLLAAPAFNPRWSPDGRYLALAAPDNSDALRIFEAATGTEVLRVTGYPVCLGDYWYADGSVAAWFGYEASVTVPGGEISRRPVQSRPDASQQPRYLPGFNPDGPLDLVDLVSDTVLWSVNTGPGVFGAYFLRGGDGPRDQLPPLGILQLGAHGRGYCDSGSPPPSVQKPPFGG